MSTIINNLDQETMLLVSHEYNEYHKFWKIVYHDMNKIASGNEYLYIMNEKMMCKAKELTAELGIYESKEPTLQMFNNAYGINAAIKI